MVLAEYHNLDPKPPPPSTLRSPKWSTPIGFSQYNSAHSCDLPVRTRCSANLNLLHLMAAVSYFPHSRHDKHRNNYSHITHRLSEYEVVSRG
jgi:hypothetical protein